MSSPCEVALCMSWCIAESVIGRSLHCIDSARGYHGTTRSARWNRSQCVPYGFLRQEPITRNVERRQDRSCLPAHGVGQQPRLSSGYYPEIELEETETWLSTCRVLK